MTRLTTFQEKIRNGQKVYMPYVLLGFPDVGASVEVARTLILNGADGLEIGFPFRDPVADGPVIERAGNIALDNGFTVDQGFAAIRQIREAANDLPLTLMLYYNIVLARGIEKFFGECKESGIDAVLIPDMPPERADTVYPAAQENGIALVFIAAPTTTPERFTHIRPYAGGFIYVVTRMGTTGTADSYSGQIADMFARFRKETDLPLIAGFGISTPEHAQRMIGFGADGVITGSRIVELSEKDAAGLAPHTQDMARAVARER